MSAPSKHNCSVICVVWGVSVAWTGCSVGPLLAVHEIALVWQAQHDYLQGNYPVVREDAAQMCALQMQAEAGPTLLDQSDGLEPYLEKFIVRQVSFVKRMSPGLLPSTSRNAHHVRLMVNPQAQASRSSLLP